MGIEPTLGQVYDTGKVVLTIRGKTSEVNGVGRTLQKFITIQSTRGDHCRFYINNKL